MNGGVSRGESRERESGKRTDQGADAEGRIQESDPGLADVQQVEGHDDEQDRVRPGDEVAGREQREENAQLPFAGDGAKAGERLGHEVRSLGAVRWLG